MSGSFPSFGSPFGFGLFGILFTIVPILVIGIIVVMIISSIVRWSKNNASPRQNRPAKIVGKRPHTWGGNHTGNMHAGAHTSYYVTFEFEDGERLELPVGAQAYGTIAEGDYGILTHQGSRYIDFQRER